MKSNYKKIGNFIRVVDERNTGHNVKNLLGLSISKQFIPSVANLVGTDMENYKIIRKNQFACSTMQVRRDKKMPVALLQEVEEAIISQAYPIFEVTDPGELLPEYLMMWFSRQEFDREACFHAIGGVRGSLEWEDFCDMKLPIPKPGKQKEIVKEYNTIVDRIALNNQIIQKLEETAQAIYRQWFVDFEYPDENGKPYKSNGGEVENISKTTLANYVVHSKQAINPNSFPEKLFYHYSIPSFDDTCLPKIELGKEILSNKFIAKDNSILISKLNPNFSRVWSLYGKVAKNSICSTEFQVLIPRNEAYFGFVFFFLKSKAAKEVLISMATGTSNSHQRVRPDNLLDLPMFKFNNLIIDKFNLATTSFIKLIKIKRDETVNLVKFKNLLLSKHAAIDN